MFKIPSYSLPRIEGHFFQWQKIAHIQEEGECKKETAPKSVTLKSLWEKSSQNIEEYIYKGMDGWIIVEEELALYGKKVQ